MLLYALLRKILNASSLFPVEVVRRESQVNQFCYVILFFVSVESKGILTYKCRNDLLLRLNLLQLTSHLSE